MTTKTSPPSTARRSRRATPSAASETAPHIWNTLGVASLLRTTPARVTRSIACGELQSTVRIVGGDQRPRFAFTLLDVIQYADVLAKRDTTGETARAAKAFLAGQRGS